MNAVLTRPSWQIHLPLALTVARMVVAPIVMAILYWQHPLAGWFAMVIFVLGSLTDWADGYFARRWSVESTAGKLLDPIADKILVLGAIVMLLSLGRVDPVMVFLLLARDILIGGIRAVAAANQVIIAAKPFGKWKTGVQMVAIPCLLVHEPLFGVIPVAQIGYYGLWVSVILSLISGTEYIMGYASMRRAT